MNRRVFLSTAAAGVLFLLGGPGSAYAATGGVSSGPIVSTTGGKLRGLFDGKVHSFKGVPYGASPSGSGRFSPRRVSLRGRAFARRRSSECARFSRRGP